MEVIPGAVLRLGRVVPWRSIPPPPGLDSTWFSSAQPAPSPEAAQSYWTRGVTPARLHPEVDYCCHTRNFALECVWKGWETATQKRDKGEKPLEK